MFLDTINVIQIQGFMLFSAFHCIYKYILHIHRRISTRHENYNFDIFICLQPLIFETMISITSIF